MNVQKCDICKKTISDNSVRAGIGFFVTKDLCMTCGKPIIDFLKKHKLISIEKIEKLSK